VSQTEEEAQQDYDPSQFDRLPITYQDLINHFRSAGQVDPYLLRKETMLRIERCTGHPLLCYVAKTLDVAPGIPAYIDDSDLVGFGDLIHSVGNDSVDILIISNGGSAEAAERIVGLIRGVFDQVRFIIPHNAFSAATLICLSGDQLLMDRQGTLGPIDPQLNGIPARAIVRAFEQVEARLKEEGPQALTAYMPLLAKYDLYLLEMCKSAQSLSEELAREWVSTYMLKCSSTEERVDDIVGFFSSYDTQKSHGRSIGRRKIQELQLPVICLEDDKQLGELVRSLHNQFELFFDKTPFYKLYENAHGISWGRQLQSMTLQLPVPVGRIGPMPQPSAPVPTSD